FCLARAMSGTEPEGVLPPNTPDKHEVRAPIRPRCGDPVVVRIFQAFEGPGPGFEAGGGVAGLFQRIWPERMIRFWCKHGRAPPREWARGHFSKRMLDYEPFCMYSRKPQHTL